MMQLLTILSIYFVSFFHKPGSSMIPFTERAIEQREKWNIPYDSLDFAVSPIYLDSIRSLGAQVMHTSRWMNGATVSIDNELTLENIRQCSFVDSVELTRQDDEYNTSPRRSQKMIEEQKEAIEYGNAQTQLEIYNLPALHAKGFEGQGIQIAVIDAGFYNLRRLTHLASLRENHLLGWRNLTDDTDSIFGSTGDHGVKCLSLIGMESNDYHGAATQADFYLIKTEETVTESPKEMDNLIVAYELADSLGINLLSVSLGYGTDFDNSEFDIHYDELDGKTHRVSRAATIAARKGMLVCNSAGNSGNKAWGRILLPADADSILTVGSVKSDSVLSPFSSRGPSADMRIKPEVCAMGTSDWTISPDGDYLSSGNGTSFSCPLIAGLAACLWSALPDESAMQIRERIIRSSHRYDHPDNDYGYGIPDALAAYTATPLEIAHSESVAEKTQKVMWNGQVIIIRNGLRYNTLGQRVE